MDLNSDFVLVDFEHAAIAAVRDYFPETTIHGCFFIYLNQSIQGIPARYNNEPDFAIQIGLLVALAYLPSNKIPAAFD